MARIRILQSAFIALLACSCAPASARCPQDSSATTSAWPFSFQPESYRENLLGSNKPGYDLLISRFEFANPKKSAGDQQLFLPAFFPLIHLKSNQIQLDTNRAKSNVQVMLGTKREQLLFINHKQKIASFAELAVNYNSIVSEGFLIHQYGKAKCFDASLKLNKGRYTATTGYNFHKVEADENGGILPDQNTFKLSKSDYALLDVYLTEATSKQRRSQVFLDQLLRLSSSTSKLRISTVVNASFTRHQRSFFSNNDSAYFTSSYIDSTESNDTLALNQWAIRAGLKVEKMPDSLSSWYPVLDLGLGVKENRYLTDSTANFHSIAVPDLKFSLQSDHWLLSWQVKAAISSADVFQTDRYSSSVKAAWSSKTALLNGFDVSFYKASLAADYNQQRFISNHFTWTLTNPKYIEISAFRAGVDLFHEAIQLYGGVEQQMNGVLFDSLALPYQLKNTATTSMFGLMYNPHWRHWSFLVDVISRSSNQVAVPVPALAGYARLAYKNRFFKSALLGEFGLSCFYQDAYKANAYQPATGLFYRNDSRFAGGQPILTFFANMGIGKAILTLQVEHFGQGWLGQEVYVSPGYPVPPRTIKFGLNWQLEN